MPPNLGPLIPNPFKTIDEDTAAFLKKLSLAAAAVAASFTLAPRYPKTIGFITKYGTGFEILPGRGVKVSPLVVGWLLPQPFGVVPPRIYLLPEGMADFSKIKGIFTKPGGAEAYFKQFPEELSRQDDEQLRKERARLHELSSAELAAELTFFERTPLGGDVNELRRSAIQFELNQRVVRAAKVDAFEFDPSLSLSEQAKRYRESLHLPESDQSDIENAIQQLVEFARANPADP